jgi:urate oxidase
MPFKLTQQGYGKSENRLVKIVRDSERHVIRDLTVDITLQGDFARCYTDADNTDMPATDSMKNSVYALADEHLTGSIEDYGAVIAKELTATGPLVHGATVALSEHPWTRLPSAEAGDEGHDHAWRRDSSGDHLAWVTWDGESVHVEAGISDLFVLKSTQSGWSNFQTDKFRTLADTDDRILATIFSARWVYADGAALDYQATWEGICALLVERFGDHFSPSVQSTIHRMCTAVLERFDAVDSISMSLPNRHHLRYDLEPFGQENTNTVFVATSEPYGLIEATVTRT